MECKRLVGGNFLPMSRLVLDILTKTLASLIADVNEVFNLGLRIEINDPIDDESK
jgi:hypothetical protein